MKKSFLSERKVPIITVTILTIIVGIIGIFNQNTFEITYKDEKISIEGPTWITDEMLFERANITAWNAEVVSRETLNFKTLLSVENISKISISVDGEILEIMTANEKIGDILEENEITLNDDDFLNFSTEMRVLGGENIIVTRVTNETLSETLEIEFEQEIIEDSSIYEGVEKITTEGEIGEILKTTYITYHNGVIFEEIIENETLKDVINQVLTVGTKKKTTTNSSSSLSNSNSSSNTNSSTNSNNSSNNTNSNESTTVNGNEIVTASGEVLSFSKQITVEASAYSTEGWTSKYTASGTLARVGAIAVDPTVIPLGTKMYITSSDGKSWIYGVATAEDTGGMIKGNKIDLFFNTQAECIQFGRQTAVVYILG